MTYQPIIVWSFYKAPEELKALSPHGGDEDWLAEIPPNHVGEYIGWLEDGHGFGCCDVSEHDHPMFEGWKVRIGAHA